MTPLTRRVRVSVPRVTSLVCDPGHGGLGGVERHQVRDRPSRRALPADGDQFHAADGAAVPRLVRLDPGVHGALIDRGGGDRVRGGVQVGNGGQDPGGAPEERATSNQDAEAEAGQSQAGQRGTSQGPPSDESANCWVTRFFSAIVSHLKAYWIG